MELTRRNLLVGTAAVCCPRRHSGYFGWMRRKPRRSPRAAICSSRRPARRHGAGLRANAPVTIVEYASMTCAHCAQLSHQDFPGAEEALHRHRQGALHPARIPARSAGDCRLHARALRGRRTSIIPLIEHAVPEAGRMGGAASRCRRSWPSPSRPASPSESFKACLSNQKILDDIEAARKDAGRQARGELDADLFHQRREARGDMSIEEIEKEIQPYLKAG